LLLLFALVVLPSLLPQSSAFCAGCCCCVAPWLLLLLLPLLGAPHSSLLLASRRVGQSTTKSPWPTYRARHRQATAHEQCKHAQKIMCYKLQVLRIKNRQACLSLCSSVRKLEKIINKPRRPESSIFFMFFS
jgi:hypothetical protein